MALEWFDGFEDYNSTFPIYNNPRYAASGTTWDTVVTYQVDGRFSDSKAYSLSGAGSPQLIYYNNPNTEFAAAISRTMSTRNDPTSSSYNLDGFAFSDGTATNDLCVAIKANGSIQVSRGSNPTTNILGTSATGLVAAGVWFHMGVEVVRHATTGSVNVYIDGVQVLALTNVNTGATEVTQTRICKMNSSAVFDDFYFCDEASWFGECRCSPRTVTADTTQKDFAPSTGSDNYACVDEVPAVTTDYVSSTTPGAVDLYETSDLPFNPLSVLGVKVTLVAAKDDITTRTYRGKVKSGGTVANGSTKSASSSYAITSDVFDKDPNTGSAWVKSGLDALQIGVEVVA